MDCIASRYNRHTHNFEPNPGYAGDGPCRVQKFLNDVVMAGGLDQYLLLYGSTIFPPELRAAAEDIDAARQRLREAVATWQAQQT